MYTPKNSEGYYQEKAEEAAGNWLHFSCFWWDRAYDLENPENYCIVYTSNRDSGLREESNASVIQKILQPYIDRWIILEERHNHWAVGYVDGYAIPVYRHGGMKITEAFKVYATSN